MVEKPEKQGVAELRAARGNKEDKQEEVQSSPRDRESVEVDRVWEYCRVFNLIIKVLIVIVKYVIQSDIFPGDWPCV